MNAPRTPADARLASAWDWFARLRDPSLGDDELAAWLSWYEADERNKQAFEEVRSFWQQAGRLAEAPLRGTLINSSFPRRRESSVPMVPANKAWILAFAGMTEKLNQRVRSRWMTHSVWAAAAVLVLAFTIGFLNMDRSRDAPQQVAAGAELVRETQLPDGSRVDLAANSSVTVEFNERERLLTLDDGVAYFTVARNRDRPFVVQVGELRVRAVGTAFNVRRARDRVVVTVTEGIVDVYPADGDAPDHAAIRAEAGREITWAARAAGPTIAAVDPARALAWRTGRLDYFNEPLAYAVADINRYSKRQIIIRDKAVGKIVFSGTVLTSQTDDWVKALPHLFPVALHTDKQGNFVLTNRS